MNAKEIATRHRIPLHADFHMLGSEIVERILLAASECKYRTPKNANGSKARYFYEYMCRSALGPKWGTEYAVQGNYGYGWDDEVSEDTRKQGQLRLREYRENGQGAYRLVTRRVKLRD